jgi:hypothetical protein
VIWRSLGFAAKKSPADTPRGLSQQGRSWRDQRRTAQFAENLVPIGTVSGGWNVKNGCCGLAFPRRPGVPLKARGWPTQRIASTCRPSGSKWPCSGGRARIWPWPYILLRVSGTHRVDAWGSSSPRTLRPNPRQVCSTNLCCRSLEKLCKADPTYNNRWRYLN